MDEEAEQAAQGQPHRRGEPGVKVALPVAPDDGVDGHRQGLEAGLLAAVDHAPGQLLVLVHVKLEHLRC